MSFFKWPLLITMKAYMRYQKHSYWKVRLEADYYRPRGRL